jgi:hypothetical protein
MCVSSSYDLRRYSEGEGVKRITVELEDTLHAKLRQEAFDREVAMADIVREALEVKLATKTGEPQA